MPGIGLAVDCLSIDLNEVHSGCAAPAREFLNFGRIPSFLGQHVDQFADDVAHVMKLGLRHDLARGAAAEQNILLASKDLGDRFGFLASSVPDL